MRNGVYTLDATGDYKGSNIWDIWIKREGSEVWEQWRTVCEDEGDNGDTAHEIAVSHGYEYTGESPF